MNMGYDCEQPKRSWEENLNSEFTSKIVGVSKE